MQHAQKDVRYGKHTHTTYMSGVLSHEVLVIVGRLLCQYYCLAVRQAELQNRVQSAGNICHGRPTGGKL